MTVEEKLATLIAEMEARVHWSIVLARIPGAEEGPAGAAGVVVLDDVTGTVMAAEVGIDDTGMASLTLRMFDADMEPVAPHLLEAGDSVMFTSR